MDVTLLFSGLLFVSIAGLFALFILKRFEMTTGRIIFGGMRPVVGAFFHAILVWLERALPALVYDRIRRGIVFLRALAQRLLARGILAAERLLEKVLRFLRHTTEPVSARTTEVSVFLREVAEHKRKLTKRSYASPHPPE